MSAHTVCAATEGDLPMEINWVFHGQKHSSMMGISTTKVGPRSNMLQIESVAAAHSGNYTCTARNAAGTRNYSANLIVFGWHIAVVIIILSQLPSFCSHLPRSA